MGSHAVYPPRDTKRERHQRFSLQQTVKRITKALECTARRRKNSRCKVNFLAMPRDFHPSGHISLTLGFWLTFGDAPAYCHTQMIFMGGIPDLLQGVEHALAEEGKSPHRYRFFYVFNRLSSGLATSNRLSPPFVGPSLLSLALLG